VAAPSTPSSEDAVVRFRPWSVLASAAAAVIAGLAPMPGLTPEAHKVLVILVAVAGLWMSEALPVAITALTIPVLALALGVADAKTAFAGFGDPIVFLFFGTFLLTEASFEHGLNDRLARSVLGSRWVKRGPRGLLWAVALLGCAISAWVNNTATTAMLLPLALTAERFGSRRLLTGTLLIAAYAPSLGGIATPVGTAPNLIGLRLLEQATGSRPSFAELCAVFAPLAIVMTALSAAWLAWRARTATSPVAARKDPDLDAGSSPIPSRGPLRPLHPARAPLHPVVAPPSLAARRSSDAPLEGMGLLPASPADAGGSPTRWSLAERTLVPIFIVVVLLWITPGILAATPLRDAAWVKAWQARLPEPAVPLLGGLALFLLPSGKPGGARILDITVLKRIDWSTLLLFGGGLSLGGLMFESGLARSLGEAIFRAMPIHGTYGVVLAATLMAVIVSEMTSNTASASLVVPVVLALAAAGGIDPVKPALAATVACSFGFMLPVSTPPNALVFGTGKLSIREMVSQGILLDILGVLLVSGWVTLFA
jgi:solute carrier family 13 (sodium-dependent dicarboxylate transporter), member 2/3/5